MALPRPCHEFHRTLQHPDRRSFVKAGILGSMGLTLADLFRSEARASAGRPTSVIILWMRGGPSHIDMWDMKPEAPAEYRGEFGTIPSAVPGVRLCELLPMSARTLNKWAIVRSLHHHDAGHSTGDQICFTGYDAGPMPDENVHPSCGSIVSRQLGHTVPHLPAYVMIPRMVPGTGPAYLGVAHKPFETQADPAQTGPFKVPNFELPSGITVERVGDRRGLLRSFDAVRREVDNSGQLDAVDRYQQKAWDVLSSAAAREAFDLDKEPTSIRERYGLMPAFDPKAADRCGCPAWSQRILLARRLVEAGVRLVTVDLRWWDTHVKGFESLRLGFLERWDRAYTALIEDLEARGLLESTLIVCVGEFGRTPKINQNNNIPGRQHWPHCYSAILSGGGIRGGAVYGESDKIGAYVKDRPVRPQDFSATIYHALGVPFESRVTRDGVSKPLSTGTPLVELFG